VSTSPLRPSAGYALVLRVTTDDTSARVVARAIEAVGGVPDGVVSEPDGSTTVHVLEVKARDEQHQRAIVEAAQTVAGVRSVEATDEVFALHEGGKLGVEPTLEVDDDDDLAQAYTPGVGRVSRAIADDPEQVWDLTGRANAVAVLTNGTAVLGLGDIGPAAALPVMEGKAMLFKSFAGIDAYPVCVDAPSVDELVAVARAIEPTFGGINLEDVAAPMCFEAERRMRSELSIPVFHDDQHGTAVVTLAALINAARVVGKRLEDLRVVFLGLGAAGVAIARLLLDVGVGDVVGCDRAGILHRGRSEHMNDEKRALAEITNREGLTGDVHDALRGADVFVGVSGPGLIEPEWVAEMASDAIVFAMANPVPEIQPEAVPPNVRIVATGRSDYPNQINNVLVFPGFFRGLLDARARDVTDAMKVAAARALAAVVPPDELSPVSIMPSPFDARVVEAVAGAVRRAAAASREAG